MKGNNFEMLELINQFKNTFFEKLGRIQFKNMNNSDNELKKKNLRKNCSLKIIINLH